MIYLNIFHKSQILSHDEYLLGNFGERVAPLLNIFNTISGFMEDRFLCHFERSNNNQIVYL